MVCTQCFDRHPPLAHNNRMVKKDAEVARFEADLLKSVKQMKAHQSKEPEPSTHAPKPNAKMAHGDDREWLDSPPVGDELI